MCGMTIALMLASLAERREFGDDWLPDERRWPLVERRARWVETIQPGRALALSEAWRGDAQRRFAQACRSGWEGLIAKRADAPYVPGRSRDWLKLKCVWEQEFVIGGYTHPAGRPTGLRARLVGYLDPGPPQYAREEGTRGPPAARRPPGARVRAAE